MIVFLQAISKAWVFALKICPFFNTLGVKCQNCVDKSVNKVIHGEEETKRFFFKKNIIQELSVSQKLQKNGQNFGGSIFMNIWVVFQMQ